MRLDMNKRNTCRVDSPANFIKWRPRSSATPITKGEAYLGTPV
jgi:hypothetical protein